jgi:hypothetical protein
MNDPFEPPSTDAQAMLRQSHRCAWARASNSAASSAQACSGITPSARLSLATRSSTSRTKAARRFGDELARKAPISTSMITSSAEIGGRPAPLPLMSLSTTGLAKCVPLRREQNHKLSHKVLTAGNHPAPASWTVTPATWLWAIGAGLLAWALIAALVAASVRGG